MNDSARHSCAFAHPDPPPRRGRFGAALCVLTWVAAGIGAAAAPRAQAAPGSPAPAVGAAPTSGAQEVLRGLLRDPDPIVRGEAALTLGTYRDPADREAITKIATKDTPTAALPAIIGLGYLGTPGVEHTLSEIFDTRSPKSANHRLAAAHGIGLLSSDLVVPAFDEFLAAVSGGSYERNAPLLRAWLAALAREGDSSHRAIARFLVDDASNRDQALRRLALRFLEQIDGALPKSDREELLHAEDPVLRVMGLEFLPAGSLSLAQTQKQVVNLCAKDPDPRVRAAALDVLTRERSFAALDHSTAALESAHAAEIAAGVRAVLAFGGHGLRKALGTEIVATNSTRRVAMLDAWTGRADPALADAAAKWALAEETSFELRRAASEMLARCGDLRADPLLANLARIAKDPVDRMDLLRALAEFRTSRTHDTPPHVLGVSRATHIAALFPSHPDWSATEFAREMDALSGSELVQCLRAWRTQRVSEVSERTPPASVLEAAPTPIRQWID